MALTRAEVETNIANSIKLAESFSSEMATRIQTMETALISSGAGERFNETLQAAKDWRATAAAALAVAAIEPMLTPQWLEFAEFLNIPTNFSIDQIIDEVFDDMVTNSKSVNSRDLTIATPGAFTGTGDGELIRLSKDKNDQDIESGHIEAKSFVIIADQTDPRSQGRNNELGEFRGSTGAIDELVDSKHTVSGLRREMKITSASDSILNNPSFDIFTPNETPFVGPLTALSGWTTASGVFTSLSIDTTNYFITNDGVAKPASLKFTGNETVKQSLTPANRFDPELPTVIYLYYNREVGTASGTITVTWGSESQALVLAAETGWNRFPIVLDKKLYPINWANDQPTFEIAVTGLSGTLLIDHVIMRQMTNFDNNWYVATAGATPFANSDSVTFTDTFAGTDSIIQKWLGIIYNKHLPHNNAGTETWADPTLP